MAPHFPQFHVIVYKSLVLRIAPWRYNCIQMIIIISYLKPYNCLKKGPTCNMPNLQCCSPVCWPLCHGDTLPPYIYKSYKTDYKHHIERQDQKHRNLKTGWPPIYRAYPHTKEPRQLQYSQFCIVDCFFFCISNLIYFQL